MMPTPTGLPKIGEVWEQTIKLPPDWEPHTTRFVVLERGRGSRWPLRVYIPGKGRKLLTNGAAWLARGQLRYVGPVGPKTRARIGSPL